MSHSRTLLFSAFCINLSFQVSAGNFILYDSLGEPWWRLASLGEDWLVILNSGFFFFYMYSACLQKIPYITGRGISLPAQSFLLHLSKTAFISKCLKVLKVPMRQRLYFDWNMKIIRVMLASRFSRSLPVFGMWESMFSILMRFLSELLALFQTSCML